MELTTYSWSSPYSLGLVVVLALRRRELGRPIGAALLVSYGLFVSYVLFRNPERLMRNPQNSLLLSRIGKPRKAEGIVIAAAIIAAVRLARDDISSPSPRIYAAVADSVSLARKILQRVIGG